MLPNTQCHIDNTKLVCFTYQTGVHCPYNYMFELIDVPCRKPWVFDTLRHAPIEHDVGAKVCHVSILVKGHTNHYLLCTNTLSTPWGFETPLLGLFMHINMYLTYILPVLTNCVKIDHIKNQVVLQVHFYQKV